MSTNETHPLGTTKRIIEQDKEILRLNIMLDALYGELGRITFEKLTKRG